LIVGGGMTADAAVHSIREIEPNSTIDLFSMESDPPYNCPPLTKSLWKGKSLSSIWREAAGPSVDISGEEVESPTLQEEFFINSGLQNERFRRFPQ
jgi:hypothetical protein